MFSPLPVIINRVRQHSNTLCKFTWQRSDGPFSRCWLTLSPPQNSVLQLPELLNLDSCVTRCFTSLSVVKHINSVCVFPLSAWRGRQKLCCKTLCFVNSNSYLFNVNYSSYSSNHHRTLSASTSGIRTSVSHSEFFPDWPPLIGQEVTVGAYLSLFAKSFIGGDTAGQVWREAALDYCTLCLYTRGARLFQCIQLKPCLFFLGLWLTCRTSQTRQYQLAISRIPFCTMNVWTLMTFYWISKLLFAESLSLSCQVTHQFPSVAGNQ